MSAVRRLLLLFDGGALDASVRLANWSLGSRQSCLRQRPHMSAWRLRPNGHVYDAGEAVDICSPLLGLVVEDLEETVRFLAVLGLDCGKPAIFSGDWIGQIIGLDAVTVELAMVRTPDGSDVFEVVRFHSPSTGAQERAPAANRPGLRHVAFNVDDVRGVVARVREAGWDTVGDIVGYENMFLLCYVRGPEGLIVELAERLDGTPD